MEIGYSMRFGTNGQLQIQPAQLFHKVLSQIGCTRDQQLVDCGPDTDPAYFSGLNNALEN